VWEKKDDLGGLHDVDNTYTWSTASPWDPTGTAFTGSRTPAQVTIRPDELRNPNLPFEERTVSRWFDPSAFAVPAAFTYGNSGRNVLRAPGLVNLDFLIARNFRLSETTRLELRGEFFNLTNTAHFGRPNATIGSPQAGTITATAAPNRQVQIGVRLVF